MYMTLWGPSIASFMQELWKTKVHMLDKTTYYQRYLHSNKASNGHTQVYIKDPVRCAVCGSNLASENQNAPIWDEHSDEMVILCCFLGGMSTLTILSSHHQTCSFRLTFVVVKKFLSDFNDEENLLFDIDKDMLL